MWTSTACFIAPLPIGHSVRGVRCGTYAQKNTRIPCSPVIRRAAVIATAAGNQSSTRSDTPTEQSLLPNGRNLSISLDGHNIAYDYTPGGSPTVVFLPSFFDTRNSQAKANALEIFARRKGQAIVVEDYLGIGRSDGDFVRDGTLTSWISHTVALIDRLPGKVVLVGAGIGGWIMLHVAVERPEKVIGLVGINPSVDFTHDLILPSLSETQRTALNLEGFVNITWGYREYPIGKPLLEDAEKWLVLRGGESSLPIKCPIRLFQGLSDEEVPSDRILKLVSTVKSDDCIVSFIKYGDHYLEEEADFERMWAAVVELSDSYFEYDLTSPGSG